MNTVKQFKKILATEKNERENVQSNILDLINETVERVKDNIDDERGKRIKSQDEILKFKDNIYNSLLKFNKI